MEGSRTNLRKSEDEEFSYSKIPIHDNPSPSDYRPAQSSPLPHPPLISSDILDLKVSIKSHHKIVESYETYIVFEVCTASQRENLQNNNYSVFRRFNDFSWLRSRLELTFPMSIIPPLPDKHSITQIERFTGTFIEQRAAALERFLHRISIHPVQSFNESFIVFLTADKEAYSRYQNSKSQGQGLLSRIVSNISMPASLSGYPVDSATINDPFYTIYKQIERLHSVMNRMEKVCERLSVEGGNWQKEITELGNQYGKLAQSEMDDNKKESIHVTLASMEKAWSEVPVSLEPWVVINKTSLLPLLHEYALFAVVIEQVLKKRAETENQLIATRQKIEKSRFLLKGVEERNEIVMKQTRSSFSGFLKKKQTPQEMEDALKAELEKLRRNEEDLQDRLSRQSEEFMAEYSRWRCHEYADLGGILKEMADKQIAHFQASVDIWTKTLKAVQTTSN